MRDIRAEAGNNLDALALLYANGEMDVNQSAAFEVVRGRQAHLITSTEERTGRAISPAPHREGNRSDRGLARARRHVQNQSLNLASLYQRQVFAEKVVMP